MAFIISYSNMIQKMNKLLKINLLLAMSVMFCLSAIAKEGMWIPALLHAVEDDMQANGLQLSAEDIYSINTSSIKDAIIHFGGGCTAEIISDRGLLLTNHHCGYGQIQSHSSVEHDYLTDGFWAMSLEDELSNPGLTATLIVRIEDVTSRVFNGLEGVEDVERKMRENMAEIEASAIKGTNHEAAIRAFNYGNSYFVIITKTYEDVRLVGAPPSSIGKFGGDTDNWVWPRHTGDFSMFRIYAGEDNEPAEYAEGNRPYKPAHHLPISMDGVEEGDFTMVFGFPGRTETKLTSYAVDYVMNVANPMRIDMRSKSLSVIDAARLGSDELRIKYAAKQSRISNAYKKWIGQNGGLKNLHALDVKRDREAKFAMASIENVELLKQFETAYAQAKQYNLGWDLFVEYFYYGPEVLRFAHGFDNVISNYEQLQKDGKLDATIEDLRNSSESYFKNYDLATDRAIFKKQTEAFLQYSRNDLPGEIFSSMANAQGAIAKEAAAIYDGSIFVDQEKVEKLISGLTAKSAKKVRKDRAYQVAMELVKHVRTNIRPAGREVDSEIAELMKTYVVEMAKVYPGEAQWADANGTLRLTYGKAEGSAPHDGMEYKFYSTSKGILQKYDPEHPDFVLPEDLIELLEKEDFGPYATEGELRVCFTGSNHTTGGNSGSPTMDGQGNLIGLNFDRSWESTMSDIMFDPNRCRNIMVDIKYVLFIVDKYAGAGYLLDEMTLVTPKQVEMPEVDEPSHW